jgi:hypothetical protein
MAMVIDPYGWLSQYDQSQVNGIPSTTGQAGFTNLSVPAVTAWTAGGGATMSNITDAAGGSNAVQATMPQNGFIVGKTMANATAGIPLWIEFDVKGGVSSPLGVIYLDAEQNGVRWWSSTHQVSSAWRHYRTVFVPRATSNLAIFLRNDNASGLVQIGQIRVYQANDPLGGNQFVGSVYVNGSVAASGAGSFSTVNTGVPTGNHSAMDDGEKYPFSSWYASESTPRVGIAQSPAGEGMYALGFSCKNNVCSGLHDFVGIDTDNSLAFWSDGSKVANLYGTYFKFNVPAQDASGNNMKAALSGITGSIGGSLLSVGCTNQPTVTVTGALTSMVCSMSGAGGAQPANIQPQCFVSAANTVTPQLCTAVAVTPKAITYNIRVTQ